MTQINVLFCITKDTMGFQIEERISAVILQCSTFVPMLSCLPNQCIRGYINRTSRFFHYHKQFQKNKNSFPLAVSLKFDLEDSIVKILQEETDFDMTSQFRESLCIRKLKYLFSIFFTKRKKLT